MMMDENKIAALGAARLACADSPVRAKLAMLFDQSTFVETGAFVKRNRFAGSSSYGKEELEGVITGYGSVDGMLVYAFAQDSSRLHGAIDENHAKKIEALYHLALSNGAPVVGIFDCAGASLYEGVSSLGAYGRMLSAFSEASGAIPQIALVSGACTGTMAAAVAMFDFVVKTEDASLYVTAPVLGGLADAQKDLVSYEGKDAEAVGYVRALLAHLPAVCDGDYEECATADDPNRLLPANLSQLSARDLLATVCDAGSMLEVGQKEGALVTALATLGGVRAALVATDASVDEGRLTKTDVRKLAKFVAFCDAFDIPVLSFINSSGLTKDAESEPLFAAELARLAQSYTEASIPMISVLCGRAIGAAYILMGSKAVGADLVYALPEAEIGTMEASSAVAFAWNDKVTATTSREEVEQAWKDGPASPLSAASYGEVDDILDAEELRARLCSALYMMRGEGPESKHRSTPAL